MLARLMKKVKDAAEKVDAQGSASTRAAEESALRAIVGSKLTNAEVEKLIQWKHTPF